MKVVISDKFSDRCCKLIPLCLHHNSCKSHRPFSLSFFNNINQATFSEIYIWSLFIHKNCLVKHEVVLEK